MTSKSVNFYSKITIPPLNKMASKAYSEFFPFKVGGLW